MKGGEVSKLTLTMEPDPETASNIHAAPPHDGFLKIPISFVDSEGAPLSDVRLSLREHNIGDSNESQAWPNEWTKNATSNPAGMATIRIQIPTIQSPEDRLKLRIWLDAECAGFESVSDREFSLTKPLPIRMKLTEK